MRPLNHNHRLDKIEEAIKPPKDRPFFILIGPGETVNQVLMERFGRTDEIPENAIIVASNVPLPDPLPAGLEPHRPPEA